MVNLAPIVVAIKQARPTYAYGQLAASEAGTTTALLVRVGMPASIPADAVISSATLQVYQFTPASGSQTVTLRRLSASFNMSATTWNNVPSLTGSSVAVTKSSPAAGTLWSWDVTSDVQAFVSGTLTNFGWRLSGSTSAGVKFRGSKASVGQPILVVEYVEPGEAPEGLSPDGGAVSLAKPVLSFLVAPDTTSVQVQVATDVSTIDYTSSEISTDVGQVDLATTSFAGLTAGATAKLWRARSRGGTGLTAWSEWATLQRTAKPTVAITSPGASSDDTSPPIIWTVAGGTQESWRVIVRDSEGEIVDDSGRKTSTALTWTPKLVADLEGSVVTIEVYVWDNVDRAITSGDPDYTVATSTFTLTTTAGVTPPAAVNAFTDGFSPSVLITATAVSAPDSWILVRDGVRLPDSEQVGGSSYTYVDWSATPNHSHTYRVARVVNKEVSSGGPVAAIAPRLTGIWLVDPVEQVVAFIAGTDAGSWSSPELAAVYQPIAGPPIRRVAYRPPATGQVTGEIVTPSRSSAYSHDATVAALYNFKSSPADRVLRLIMGDRAIPVNVGDITISPLPTTGEQLHSAVSFTWWQVGQSPWKA